MAYPVSGVCIVTPTLIHPLAAASAALIISRPHSAPLAYIGESLVTLIGADLMNLDTVQGLGAPVASIGCAGKFDGIFQTGVIAVLIAGITSRKKQSSGRFYEKREPGINRIPFLFPNGAEGGI